MNNAPNISITISEKQIAHNNSTKKRSFNPENWRTSISKRHRNAGEPYISKRRVPIPGKTAPSQAKICSNRCNHVGCQQLNLVEKNVLHTKYYAMGVYELQRTYLLSLIDRHQVGNSAIYTYYIKLNGARSQVCKRTFMDTFSISKSLVEQLHVKSTQGQMSVHDGRGKHSSHRTTPIGVSTLMTTHINAFPQYECHYSMDKLNKFYLSSDLTLERMFALFVQQHGAAVVDATRKKHLYIKCFRAAGLQIGEPRTDTCKECDILNVNLKLARRNNNANDINLALAARLSHLDMVKDALDMLKADEIRSQVDPEFVMLCGDLQQVLFCPTLTHGEMFYKRQLSTYNYCVYDGRNQLGTMALWDETVGNRGVDEVASILLEFIATKFVRLQVGQQRTLVFWCDRCRGQTNNYQIICLMKFLIMEGFFTTVEQKLLPTGHSYMPCDRLFGLIQQTKKTGSVMVPNEWETVIQSTCVRTPFPIQRMNQQNIFDVKQMESFIPRPYTLKVSEVYWFRMTLQRPEVIHTKPNFSPGLWNTHVIRRPFTNGPINRRPLWSHQDLAPFIMLPKYHALLPISTEKFADLQTMLPLLLPEYRAFYQTLLH